jgi:polysaccharide deacetylase family protein (PEP-CTERM system associated)
VGAYFGVLSPWPSGPIVFPKEEYLVVRMKNILQIDVEDWYCDLDPQDWNKFEPRVVAATGKVLSMLRDSGNKATFFVLGYVAERFPDLVKDIMGQGHEVATHGYGHRRILDQTPEEFERDVGRSIAILESITGKKIKGYRAPQFTIVKETLWALEILKKLGLEYDSSIFPVRTPLYGIEDAPLFPYKLGPERGTGGNHFMEIPLSVYTTPLLGKRVPVAGGFYFRLFPYFFIRHALKSINKTGNVAVCYIHPWELDPGKPRIDGLRWYHYYRLAATEKKFRRLLEQFAFISTEEWIQNERRD